MRSAVPEDALDVARVHVRSWQSAYQGLIAQDYLDSLDPEVWARRYTFGRRGIEVPSTLVAVAETTVCGFATTSLSRDEDLPNFGELRALYVDPAYVGTGVGRLLITAARAQLGRAVTSAALWVLDNNVRARLFYERDGWTCDGTSRTDTFGSSTVAELRYRRALS